MAYLDPQRQQEISTIIEDIRIKTEYSYPEKNIVDLALELGVTIFEVGFDEYPDINAMLVYRDEKNKNRPSIYLRKALSNNRKRFTIAHELGHYILHKKDRVKFRLDGFDYSGDSDYSREETEANYFAACVLVPRKELLRLLPFFSKSLDKIAKYFGVSIQVVENRIKWLKTNPQL